LQFSKGSECSYNKDFSYLPLPCSKNCDESKVIEIDSKKVRVKTYLATLFHAKKIF
jgi:hypothetical protein